MPATDSETTISNLEHGKTYYFRCRAGNLKEFSDYQYPTPVSVTVSSEFNIVNVIALLLFFLIFSKST